MIIGYARVSTGDQNLNAQRDALTAVGAELDQLIDQLRDGDVVVVTKYDRLARSLRDLLDIVETIGAKGAGFQSLAEDIDTTTSAGRLIFHVFASIAQFESLCEQSSFGFCDSCFGLLCKFLELEMSQEIKNR